MSKGGEASGSRPHPDNSEAVVESVDFLLNESKQLRGEVHCGKSLQTLIFYSRIINTAVEATKRFKTMVDKFNAITSPSSEAEHIANLFKKACDVNKEVIRMMSNDFHTSSSSTNTGGGYKKVLIWKKQCDKNIDKIESLIKEAFSREFHTWYDAFAFHAMFQGFSGIIACLYHTLTFKETSDDQKLKAFAKVILGTFEEAYKNILSEEKDKFMEGMTHQRQKDENSPKGRQAVVAQKKNIQEEETGQRIIQEQRVQKNSQEAEISRKLLAEKMEDSQEEKAFKRILAEGMQKSSQEREVNKKIQVEETMKKSQEEENTGDDEIFRFGALAFKKKKGGMERVPD